MRASRPPRKSSVPAVLGLLALLSATGAAPRLVYLGTNANVNALTVLSNGTAALVGSHGTAGQPMIWYVNSTSVAWGSVLTGPSGQLRLGEATGISPDGNYISGYLYKNGAPLPFQSDGAVWNRLTPTAPTVVPDLSDPFPSTSLSGVSNSKVAVGTSSQSAYRWTTLGGGAALPDVGSSASWANGIDASGLRIVGAALDDIAEHPIAVVWNSGVYSVLDPSYSAAYNVSANGRFIVGVADLVDDELLELDAVYWDNGQRQVILDAGTQLPIEGQAQWATDSGIIGGSAGPPGGTPEEGWLYFEGSSGALPFTTWYRQITGLDFPVAVTSVAAAAERNGELFLSLNGGDWLAVVLWAAPADANRDRIVDGGDYTIWADNYLDSIGTSFEAGDFNGDKVVDGGDYTIWADNYNGGLPALALAAPEPASVSLLATGLLGLAGALFARRRSSALVRHSARQLLPS